jgi:L-threonylcarbamoyladenylate synthase
LSDIDTTGAPQAGELAANVPTSPPSTIVEPTEDNIARAAQLLAAGELVAFPTETVYGLGANAASTDAVRKIFKLKGRPADHPVIVHVSDATQLDRYARDIPAAARTLARHFWPGPLTLVLQRAEGVPDAVTGGQETVALRAPAHPVARALLAAFGSGIAAPSANRFGRISPTLAAHVAADFGANAPMILDGDAAQFGIESTIVDLTGTAPRLLRPGAITAAQIEEALGVPLAADIGDAPRAPGTLDKHYAPRAAVRLVNRVEMIDLLATARGKRVAVLALEVNVPRLAPALVRVAPAVAAQYAQTLYANLRALDATGADLILVERPPQSASWAAVNDRLRRAAAPGSEKEARAAQPG